jgi:uncharacterized protein (DUF433 family)
MATRQTSYKYIHRVPGVRGGDPVLRGSSIPVWIIVGYWQMYGTVDQVNRAFPHLSREAIEEALVYYEAHREEIDGRIEENDRLANTPNLDVD